MTDTTLAPRTIPYNRFRELIKSDNVQERFQQLLDKRSTEFLASLLSLVSADDKLLECDLSTIFTAAAKAAILRLPIAKELGYAWIVPFKREATFIIGWKGLVQLAIRTGQYYALNAAEIYEGEKIKVDRITGAVEINGKRTGDDVIGYISYFKLKNGFEKFLYLTSEEIHKHAKRYSKSYGNDRSAWTTNLDDMAKKTVLRLLLGKYGLLSISMMDSDTEDLPVSGDDPRLAMPEFGDVLEGEFAEPQEQSDEAVQPDPVPVEHDQEFTPEQIYQAVVDAKLSENIHAARNTLNHCTTGYETPERAVAWMKSYRGFKDMGGSTEQAAKEANAGNAPH